MGAHSRKRQGGFTLIEALVAMFVTALGILGILGVQMRTLADTQTAVRRAQAVRLIEDLGERLRASPNALVALNGTGAGLAKPPLSDILARWEVNVATLPAGQAKVFAAPGATDRELGVLLAWRENERADADDEFKQAIDAVAAAGGTGGNSDNECPSGFTCHLQYIPVPARCAPYAAGGGDLQFFCP